MVEIMEWNGQWQRFWNGMVEMPSNIIDKEEEPEEEMDEKEQEREQEREQEQAQQEQEGDS